MKRQDAIFCAEQIEIHGKEGLHWVVKGPSLSGVGGFICTLGAWPPEDRIVLNATTAASLAAIMDDVWRASRRRLQRELRADLGIDDWVR